MIVIDTSAVIAIAFEEPEGEPFVREIAGRGAIVATTTLVKASTVLSKMKEAFATHFLGGLVRRSSVRTVAFSFEMYGVARAAYRLYGKSLGHLAKLYLGDCLSYAVAKVHDLPLLLKGVDFTHTGIVPAWRP